jgi:hypothetical protein
MEKTEIAAALRQEVGELDFLIKKLQDRCEKLKTFVLNLEAEIEGPKASSRKPPEDGRFRGIIDSVFGEKPKRRKS